MGGSKEIEYKFIKCSKERNHHYKELGLQEGPHQEFSYTSQKIQTPFTVHKRVIKNKQKKDQLDTKNGWKEYTQDFYASNKEGLRMRLK